MSIPKGTFQEGSIPGAFLYLSAKLFKTPREGELRTSTSFVLLAFVLHFNESKMLGS